MSVPTRAEIKALEDKLGFPFRSLHFTDEEGGDDGPYFRHDVMPADFVQLSKEQVLLNRVKSSSVSELITTLYTEQDFIDLNNLQEDEQEQRITDDEELEGQTFSQTTEVYHSKSVDVAAEPVQVWPLLAEVGARPSEISDPDGLQRAISEQSQQRKISVAHEGVYRLCHHDYMGLTIKQAATVLQCSEDKIERTLAEVERVAPQLFPILTTRQVQVRDLVNEGHTNAQIALILDVSKSAVSNVLHSIRKKGVLPIIYGGDAMLSYEDGMDNQIQEKF